MSLTPGTRLGSYDITAQIGAGGMGEVYQATDTNLKRSVAIKVLPASIAGDAERLARFQREAEVLAALNHPNIAAIYDLQRSGSTTALVMELVEGPALADRIARGPIPVDEALPIAKQIAEALEAAHEQGIIHRDLKPANIKIRPDGTVKVLDFGLAKALAPVTPASVNVTASPTITSPALITGVGMLLGTAAYMSPEQARGKAVDKRSDIWAFGCVLYEMLTGQRAFIGDDISDTLANVLKVEPTWESLPSALSPTLVIYTKRCLSKDPKQRLGDMHDMRLALDGAFETGIGPSPLAAKAQSMTRRLLPFTAGVVCASAVIGLGAWALWPGVASRPVTRFAYDLATPVLRRAERSVMALAPDGRTVVYNTSRGLYLQTMDALEGRLIPGTEGDVSSPFFSPDGQFIGYWNAASGLVRIAVSGGAPSVIAPAANPWGPSWAADGTILFGRTEGIMRVSSTGGTPKLVIKAGDGERVDGPQLLPDGDSVLFSVTTGAGDTRWDQAKIVVQSLRTGARTVVLEGGSDARYVRPGYLVYARGITLLSVPFDAARLTVTGGSVTIAEGVRRTDEPRSNTAAANYGVSDDGTLVYVGGGGSVSDRRVLVWVDREGREELVAAPARPYVYPRLSPDGARVALRIRDQQGDIWVWDLARKTLTRTTFTPGEELYVAWTPDGRRLLFDALGDDGRPNVFWQAADGTGAAERLTDSPDSPRPFSVSPDGKRAVLRVGNVAPRYDLAALVLATPRRTEPLLTTPFNETNAEISPDGRWLVYESDESGRSEIYVRPFPNVDGGRWQISGDGGTRPLWSRDGAELFYIAKDDADTVLMRVMVERGGTWIASAPTRLFGGRYFADDYAGAPGQGRTYDISPDGRRFLMVKQSSAPDGNAPPVRLVVVQNWQEGLKRIVPSN